MIKAKYIELKNGQIMNQPDLEVSTGAQTGFLIVKHSGKLFYMNKDIVASFEVDEKPRKSLVSFD
ncbi:hypothetical protein LNN31_00565 [Acetobacterium wieringae]|uniref:Uncharacterized protein n=1 Tax=Acetobacterium wieringae TaxID=52694 RepID=A0ABY6HEK9_9FIRM|nr:hypothetical protein [Acetobacterium wieringae]MEA4804785.1 hypothetical protein [Acetobacterium wieringae]UYO62975.1 hypothetical protein LNN31_00565 [Acetobacterium wieringae]VUZ22845.1 Uncharacterised protein [Acetobacterium wieringae]